ncbi:MAG: LacI family DNA-binding transcriptional regulator [Eubacteriales bacterium]|nr:LacI family DNA-binding transcriptional regulator [Eubacteriales bacterium]
MGRKKTGIPVDKKITIYDIAREAQVSPATVSRVLTGRATVKAETKEKIEALIRQYDFKPNALAKSLRETKSRVIGMILIDFVNPFYAMLLSVCENEARKRGYSLIVSCTVGKIELEDKYLDQMYEQRVGAIIEVGGGVDERVTNEKFVEHVNRIANSIPIIITGRLDGADCYQVNLDEMKAAELAVEHLISLGHKRIAYIGGNNNVKSTMEKRSRYIQLLQKNGIPVRNEYILDSTTYDSEGGYACMENFFSLDPMPTALIAINDYAAAGIIRAIYEKGLRIPEDISVVSFDNTYISRLYHPQLTSVNYNFEVFGKKIIDVAIGAMNKKKMKRNSLISPSLIVRGSCCPPES